jgi:hypothetical protein
VRKTEKGRRNRQTVADELSACLGHETILLEILYETQPAQ